jgi:acyl carrier protein
MRILDEVAAAIRLARGGRTLPLRSSVMLVEQFDGPVTVSQWDLIHHHLDCPLPQLEFVRGQWFRTDSLQTVWDLVAHVARYHPDWELPTELTSAAWRNAQIFAGVRAVMVERLSMPPEQVTRSTRFLEDLDMD